LNLAKCRIDILVGYFVLAKGGNLNISVKVDVSEEYPIYRAIKKYTIRGRRSNTWHNLDANIQVPTFC